MRFRETRTRAKLSQQQMADIFGVPLITYEQWETGKRKCPMYVEHLIVEKLVEFATMSEDEKERMNLINIQYDEEMQQVKALKERSAVVFRHRGINIYSLKEADPEVDNLDYFTIVGIDIRYFPNIGDAVTAIDKDWEA
jgi:transcriptional regulator with XRE-family HTH domain